MADVDIQVEIPTSPQITVELAPILEIPVNIAATPEVVLEVSGLGPSGKVGQGVAIGGTSGQVLAKASSSDYDTEWVEQTGGGSVSSVNSQTGDVVLTKSDVGLSNVDNSSDADKPVSTATSTALASKADTSALTAHTGNTSNPHAVTKNQVGLSNVPNTDFTAAVAVNTAKRSYPSADETKLSEIAPGATQNAPDAALRDRTTHTGSQAISTVTGLQTALDGKQGSGDYATNTALTSGLSGKANSSHTHAQGDVTGLTTALSGKAATSHTHAQADVTGLSTALGAKADTSSLAPVAISGSYTDLTSKPTIPAQFNPVAGTNVTLSGTYPNITFNSTAAGGASVLDDLTDVDTAAVTDGQSLVYQSSTSTWKPATVSSGGGVTDHGALTGLGDDDHPQYALTDGSRGSFATTAQGSKADTAVQAAGIANFETTTQLNTRDTNNRARANHTGSQAISTIMGLQTALDGKQVSGDYATNTALADGLATKAATSHTHGGADITGTGKSGTTFLRGDNTWVVPTNTTYTEITEAELTTGTASTARTMSGRRAKFNRDIAIAAAASYTDSAVSGKADTSALASHTGNTANPHSVTKAQVGLSNVPNTDFTSAVASNTVKRTYPLTDENRLAAITDADYKNSNTTKAQVGLGSVDNTSDATKNSATATLTNKDLSSATNKLPTSVIGRTELTSGAITHSTGDTAIISISVTVPTGNTRDLELELIAPQIQANQADNRVRVDFFDGTTVIQRYYHSLGNSNRGPTAFFKAYITAPSAGSYTYTVYGLRDIGTGTVTWYNDSLAKMTFVAKLV